MTPVTAGTPATPVMPLHRSLYAATHRAARRQWRIRDLLIVRRVDLRPGEEERKVLVQHLLDRWLRDPFARAVLADILRRTGRGWGNPDGCRADEYERWMRTALREAFRCREIVIVAPPTN